eukprot:GFYU01002013.1.p1 GENE.GFYU01002013.1~~GFYU01002013.1.p1  ORF type:complete len:189 (-),score=1.75 GFYU01002013.1:61-603(-)
MSSKISVAIAVILGVGTLCVALDSDQIEIRVQNDVSQSAEVTCYRQLSRAASHSRSITRKFDDLLRITPRRTVQVGKVIVLTVDDMIDVEAECVADSGTGVMRCRKFTAGRIHDWPLSMSNDCSKHNKIGQDPVPSVTRLPPPTAYERTGYRGERLLRKSNMEDKFHTRKVEWYNNDHEW